MRIQATQIDSASLALAIQQASSGAAFSGNFISFVSASGWIGPTALAVTGGAQTVLGLKTFVTSPQIPYSGNTGTAPSAQWVLDQIASLSGWNGGTYVTNTGFVPASGQLAFNLYATGSGLYTLLVNQSGQGSSDYATKTALTNTGAALSRVTVTGGTLMQLANLSGLGTVTVYSSGSTIYFSGAPSTGGGGGSSNTSVTGSAAIAAPNFTGVGSVVTSYNGTYVYISGTNSSSFKVTGSSSIAIPNLTGVGTISATYDGTYVIISGISGADSLLSGYLENTFMRLTGTSALSGTKTFNTTPLILTGATAGPEAVNLTQASGISGVLRAFITGVSGAIQAGSTVTNNYFITGTGVVTASSTGNVTNTFNVTSGSIYPSSSGTVTNTFNGAVNNVTNISGVTGNFVNISFFYDSSNLATGLNSIEAFVGRSFTLTGYAIGCYNTGTQGYFSGSFYQRTITNAKTNFVNFSLNSGMYFTGVGGFNQTVSGMNRMGLDIYLIGTGITGLSIGAFGVGY